MERKLSRYLATAVAAVALIGAVAANTTQPAAAADASVQWKVPTTNTTTVNTGDSVTWTWGDALPHSVSSVSGPVPFDSGTITGAGSTFSFTFPQAGTYTYRCNIHPSGMTGTVVVEQAASPTPPTTTTATPTTPSSTTTPTTPVPTGTSLTGAKTVTLSGAEEVPPVTSTTTGTFEWTLTGDVLSYRLRVNGDGLKAAHLHLGPRGSNGPVVVTLFNSTDGAPSIDVSGTVLTASLSGPVAGNMADFLAALRSGNLYVNVHSAAHPAGVLRGQVPAQPAPPATGSGLEGAGSRGHSWPRVALALGTVLAAGGAATALRQRGRRATRR